MQQITTGTENQLWFKVSVECTHILLPNKKDTTILCAAWKELTFIEYTLRSEGQHLICKDNFFL